jgi:ABC-type branched-subunit amino acid transport system ATPase component
MSRGVAATREPEPRVGQGQPPALRVDGVTVRFGGLVALEGVSLSVPVGALHGLIGPNGAGKTTLFEVCSGFLRPSAGRVELFGRDVSDASPAVRARLGLSRTFQRVELCDALTVAENVALAGEARRAGANPLRQLRAGRRERAAVAEATGAALERCGLTGIAGRPAGSLPTGTRRLVELARLLAGGYQVLLLDEPSSGLDHGETERFGALLQAVVREGVSAVLVEHHMELVLSVCEQVHVLDFGRLVCSGTPGEVRGAEAVRQAYLGAA